MAVKSILLYILLILIVAEFCVCYIDRMTEQDIEELRQFLDKLPLDIEKDLSVLPGELSPVAEPYIEIQ